MNKAKFISLCKETPAIPYKKPMKTHSIIQTEKGISKVVNEDPLLFELKSILIPSDEEDAIDTVELSKLKRGLIYSLIIENNNDAKIAIDILITLHALFGTTVKRYRNLDHNDWSKAIGLLKGYLAVNYTFCENEFTYPNKSIDRAKAALELQKWGVNVSVNESELEFKNLSNIYNELDNRIKCIGGCRFIERLLDTLHYSHEFGRYIIPKLGNGMRLMEEIEPDIPYNYLLNLGIKNLSESGDAEYDTDEYFNDVLEFAKTISFATLSSNYSFWENIFLGDKNPMEYIRDYILRESVFNLNQSSLRFIINFVSFICTNATRLIDESKLSFTLKEYFGVIQTLAYKSEKNKFKILPISILKSKYVRKSSLKYIIDNLSLPRPVFNKDFSSPTDYEHVNFWNYPIAKIDDKHILLFPQTIASRGWYEGLINLIRQSQKRIDGDLGDIIENYFYHLCNKSNIECVTGDYKLKNGDEGECDALIEATKEIALIEIKKRSLIRDSRAGKDYQIIINLIDVLKSQCQAFKTSYGLKNESPFTLTAKDGVSHEVSLNDRGIERITLTLFPYGEIQDRVIFERLIEFILQYKFSIEIKDSPEDTPEIKKQNKSIIKKFDTFEEIKTQFIKYLNELNEKRSLFNGWFLDMEQVQYLLKQSKNADDFIKSLNDIKFVTTGTFDFYNEILLRKYPNPKQN